MDFLIEKNLLKKYVGTAEDVVIPEGITEIASKAFVGCSHIRSVIIPKGVKEIKSQTFYALKNIQSVTLPEGLISINRDAFWGCKNLHNIQLPPTLKKLGNCAFHGCEALKELILPEGLEIFEEFVFNDTSVSKLILPSTIVDEISIYGVNSLEEIEIKCDVKVNIGSCPKLKTIKFWNILDHDPFWNKIYSCDSLTTVIMPNSVGCSVEQLQKSFPNLKDIIIDTNLYLQLTGKTQLEEFEISNGILKRYFGSDVDIEIPNGVTELDNNAFLGVAVNSIKVPEGVTRIPGGFLDGCKTLKTVVLPNSLTEIGPEAFSACSNLENINLPNNVGKIGKFAFCHCQNLTNITFPSQLTVIEEDAFHGCSSLTEVNFANVQKLEGGAFWGCSNLREVKSNNFKDLGFSCFYKCTSLENVHLSGHLAKIDWGAFGCCSNLKSFYVEQCSNWKQVRTENFLTGGVFDGCCNLETVTINSGKIADLGGMFTAPNLRRLVLGEGVTTIDGWDESNNLEEVIVSTQNPYFRVEGGIVYHNNCGDFGHNEGTTIIGCLKSFINPIRVLEGVESIEMRVFKRDGIQELIIPDSVKRIVRISTNFGKCGDRHYFSWDLDRKIANSYPLACCSKIKISPTNPNFIIKNDLLLTRDGKTVLLSLNDQSEEVIIPDGVVRIGNPGHDLCGVFQHHKNLKKVVFPSSLAVIEKRSFFDCNLSEIVLPDSVNFLGEECFANNGRITITLSSQLQVIGKNAFSRTDKTYQQTDIEGIVVPQGIRMDPSKLVEGNKTLKVLHNFSKYQILGKLGSLSELKDVQIPNESFDGLHLNDKFYLCLIFLDKMQMEDVGENIIKLIAQQCKKLITHCVEHNDVRRLSVMLNRKMLSKEHVKYALSISNKNVEITAMLLEYQNSNFKANPGRDIQSALKSLDRTKPTMADLKKIWAFETYDNNKICITGYRGAEEDVVIPSTIGKYKVVELGQNAFNGYSTAQNAQWRQTGIKSITIPASVTYIGLTAFEHCLALEKIVVDEGNVKYYSEDGVLFDQTLSKLIFYPRGKKGNYTIPSTVSRIDCSAFEGCNNLGKISFPSSLRVIASQAFAKSNISEVIINSSISNGIEIGEEAFASTRELSKVIFNCNIRRLASQAFYASGVKEVSFNKNIKYVVSRAFMHCRNLEHVTINCMETQFDKDVFLSSNFFIMHTRENSDAHKYARNKHSMHVEFIK